MLYKVPFREIRANRFRDWFKETVWEHVVLRLWPHALRHPRARSTQRFTPKTSVTIPTVRADKGKSENKALGHN